MTCSSESQRYPIGKFQPPAVFDASQRALWMDAIAALPEQLIESVRGWSDSQLDTPYREGGWSVRQLVHHLADSHLNSYIRFRWALTEDMPVIKAYDEKLWAELPDARLLRLDSSLMLLKGLHLRWTDLLRHLKEGDFERRLVHPVNGEMDLNLMLALYAWHGHHHVAHITALRERAGW